MMRQVWYDLVLLLYDERIWYVDIVFSFMMCLVTLHICTTDVLRRGSWYE